MDDSIIDIKNHLTGISIDEQLANRQLIIFGASSGGIYLKNYLGSRGYVINYYCDNDEKKWGTLIEGIEVIRPYDLINLKQGNIFVCIASNWAREIALQLKQMGIEYLDLTNWSDRWKASFDTELINNNFGLIEKTYRLFDDQYSRACYQSVLKYRLTMKPELLCLSDYEQYFHPLVKPEEDEVIIDGGAFDGITALRFSLALEGNCTIYSFEPELRNWKALQDRIAKHGLTQVKAVKLGLWNQDSHSYINNDSNSGLGFYVDENGTQRIGLTSIDSFVNRESIIPDLIKLDIEGSELKALQGAVDILKRYRPKLITSVYHKPGDLWEIPLYINSLDCGYRFYLGHHSQNITETVLYCRAD